MTHDGRGVRLAVTDGGAVEIVLGDGRQRCAWRSDRGAIRPDSSVHLVATVDGGPRIITFVVEGVLCDGGNERQFGWGRFSPTLRRVNGAAVARIGPGVRLLRVYGQPLTTSEAVAHHRAWRRAALPSP